MRNSTPPARQTRQIGFSPSWRAKTCRVLNPTGTRQVPDRAKKRPSERQKSVGSPVERPLAGQKAALRAPCPPFPCRVAHPTPSRQGGVACRVGYPTPSRQGVACRVSNPTLKCRSGRHFCQVSGGCRVSVGSPTRRIFAVLDKENPKCRVCRVGGIYLQPTKGGSYAF